MPTDLFPGPVPARGWDAPEYDGPMYEDLEGSEWVEPEEFFTQEIPLAVCPRCLNNSAYHEECTNALCPYLECGGRTADPANPKDRHGDLKPQLWLVPPSATIEEAMVFALGAAKYGPYNWREKSVKAHVYVAAILRHLFAWMDREDVDPESNRSHLAHVRACCGILLDAAATGNLIDDRPKAGASAAVIKRLTKAAE